MKTMRARTLAYLISAVALTGLATWSCGNKESSGTGNPSPTSTAPPPNEAPAGGGTAASTTASKPGEVSLAVGEAVFKTRCELCHGASGMGDGVGGAALNPKPRNFHDKAYMSTLTDEQIVNTILNGKPGTAMPPWKGIVTEDEAKSLVLKVRSFSKS